MILGTFAINFVSSKDNDEEQIMHSKSDNIKIMINDYVDEVIQELFQSLLFRYQIGLEILMKGSESVFDRVQLVYYNCHQINCESYVNSLTR